MRSRSARGPDGVPSEEDLIMMRSAWRTSNAAWLVGVAVAAGMGGVAGVPALRAQVVISQVNGNGGLTGDPYDRDFVELFNRGSTPVNLAGWTLQLWGDTGSATTPATPSWDVIPLSGTILPGQYFLVAPSLQRGSLGSLVTTSPLPAPDVMGPVYDGAILVSTVNAVALMSSATPIPAGQCPAGPDLVDLFRYGHPNCVCFEGPAPAPPCASGLGGAQRNGGGCDDTNSSVADITTSLVPAPRNSDVNVFVSTTASPSALVTGTGGPVTITATRGPSPCNPLAGPLTAAAANLAAFGLSSSQAMFDDGTNGDAAAGDGVFTVQFTVPPAQPAGAYVIPVTGTSGAGSLPSSVRVRVFPVPAANDACAGAVSLNGPGIDIVNLGPYTVGVNNSAATGDGIDAGTCNGDSQVLFSVWYSFTAPAAGALRITETSTEDIVSSLHASCGAASSICMNREDGGFPVAAGVTSFIQVGRETASAVTPQVPLNLTFTWVPAVANDTPCAAAPIAAFPFSDAPFAPAAGDEPYNISCDAAANPGARHGVWYTFTPAASGALEIFERSINPTNFTLFTGASCASVAAGTCVDESLGGAVIGGLTAGTTYWLLVSYDPAPTTSTPSQPYDFTINFLPTPANDLCAGAVDLNAAGLPYAETVRARAATGDAGVPTGTGGSGVNTCGTTLGTRPAGVWYVYTTGPAVSGTLRVAEFSSNDVFYNVFNACGGAAVQCYGAFSNDDIFIQLAPSTTYYILVGMQSTTALPTGDYSLTFTLYPAPPNDLPCAATHVASSLTDLVAGPSATADIDVSCNYTNPPQSTTGYGVWYHFAPATPRRLYVRNSASDVLVFGLFSGPDCSSLTEVECRMGSNGQLSDNFAYFNLAAGAEYWLLVGKIASSQPFGFYNLTIELQEPQGACCVGNACTITTQAACAGTFRGAFTYCADFPNYAEAPAAPIPDATSGGGGTPGVLTRTLTVPDAGTVSDLKVLIDLSHARVGDLIITLAGPGGGVQDLIRRIDDQDGGCPSFGQQGRLTDLGAAYIFDDQSVNPYGPSMPPAAKYFDFTGLVVPAGRFRPTTCSDVVVNLSAAFAGQTMTGTWTLTISDNQASSTGVLHRWGLILNGGPARACCPADFDGNGAIQPADVAGFVNLWFASLQQGTLAGDFDGNAAITPADVAALVNAWFVSLAAGC
jgi:subtilisin-like proprotein convertase family protein